MTMHAKPYGQTDLGLPIQAPGGWRLLGVGEAIPPVHRECDGEGRWLQPRRCISTMTPLVAGVSGFRRAFAVPVAAIDEGTIECRW